MDLPDIGRYRRRFIVEFGPEDSGLIDRMGVAHRTKRAAIIAGLRLLESGEVERLQKRVADLEREVDTASKPAPAARAAEITTKELAKIKADLVTERAAHRRTAEAHARSKTALTKARDSLTHAEQELAGVQAERDTLATLLPLNAFCQDCQKLVPESEWAEHVTVTGVDVYHKKHRYREKGALRSGTTPLFQRRLAGQVGQ